MTYPTLKAVIIAASIAVLTACGGGGDGGGGGGTPGPAVGCAGASFSPLVSYPALSASVGSPVSLAPSTNVPAACAGSVSYSVISGGLPAGLSLDTTTGIISGTPTTAQSASYAVSMDVAGYTAVSTPLMSGSVLVGPPVLPKQWTMMVYIAGDNNLAQFAIEDLNELKAAATSANINVVVQIEKGGNYANTGFVGNPGQSTYRGLINGSATSLTDIGNQNMGAASTLSSFISWAKSAYPANNYSLVLWSHGGGWKGDKAFRGSQAPALTRGALEDANSNSFMSLGDIRSAITTGMGAGNKLGVLAFDACVMGQYEVAYEMRNLAHYLVASEENVPGTGLPYTQVVNSLVNAPTSTPLQFATNMTNAYKTAYLPLTSEKTTLSVTDLSQMNNVHSAVQNFAAIAQSNLASQAAVLLRANTSPLTFGGTGSGSDSIDLWRYADYVASNSTSVVLISAANALKAAITAAIPLNTTTGAAMANAKGMAINFPFNGGGYNASSYINATQSNTAAAGIVTWANFLSSAFAGIAATNTVAGDFSYYITWTAPVGWTIDVDLAINEPRGNWASPAISTTSPNGNLSADSSDSGQNFEAYSAKPQVEVGAYDVFANLYSCRNAANALVTGSACSVQVTLCSKTGAQTSFTCGSPANLNLGQQVLGGTFYSQFNNYINTVATNTNPYKDWYWFGRISRGATVNKPDAATSKPIFVSNKQ